MGWETRPQRAPPSRFVEAVSTSPPVRVFVWRLGALRTLGGEWGGEADQVLCLYRWNSV